MDPFAERDMIECLKSIALSLRNIDRKLDDLTLAVRESNSDIILEGDDEDATEGLNDPTIKFEIDEDETVEDGKFVEDSEEGEGTEEDKSQEKDLL